MAFRFCRPAVVVAVLAAAVVAVVGGAGLGCVRADLQGRRCAGSADCVDGYRCVADVCLSASENPAVATLLDDDCPTLLGEDAVGPIEPSLVPDATRVTLVGVLLPQTKAGEPFATGVARQEAIGLGLTEVNRNGGVFGRSVVGVACNSDGEVDTARRAAAHLAHVGVPVVLGEQSSSTTLAVFSDVLRPAGVMMIAPSATSVDLSTVPDDGLLARTTVGDARQAEVLGAVLVGGHSRVAVVAANDSYGDTLLDGVLRVVCAAINCGNPQDYVATRVDGVPDAAAVDAVAAAIDPVSPAAIAVIGQAAQVRPLVERLGALHPTALLVLSDAARNDAFFTTPPLAADIVARVVGTAPSQRLDGDAFAQLRGNLSPAAADASFVAHAYDAAVVAGLLHAAAGDALHPTGAALAARLSQLVADAGAGAPTLATIGSSGDERDVAVALRALEQGTGIDLQGTSGPLDFDDVGDVSGDIELWRRCAGASGDVTVSLGVALRADGVAVAVEQACRCTLAGVGCPAGQVCADDGDCLAVCEPSDGQCTTLAGTPSSCVAVGGGAFGCR